jgi:hypothetical protein
MFLLLPALFAAPDPSTAILILRALAALDRCTRPHLQIRELLRSLWCFILRGQMDPSSCTCRLTCADVAPDCATLSLPESGLLVIPSSGGTSCKQCPAGSYFGSTGAGLRLLDGAIYTFVPVHIALLMSPARSACQYASHLSLFFALLVPLCSCFLSPSGLPHQSNCLANSELLPPFVCSKPLFSISASVSFSVFHSPALTLFPSLPSSL